MTSSSVYHPAALCAVVLLSMFLSLVDASVFYGAQFGGPHGSSFSDAEGYRAREAVTRITIRTGERVDLVQFTTQYRTLTHGGNGGTLRTLALGSGEHIHRYEACWGKKNGHTRVFYIHFTTTLGHEISGGSRTDDCGSYNTPDGTRVFGMHGRSGEEVDKLGMLFGTV